MPDNHGTTNTTPAANNDGTTNNAAHNSEIEVLGSVTPAAEEASSGASTPPSGTTPVAQTASGKTQRRITIATLSLAGLIVLAGIFGSGVLLGTHLTAGGEASQGQMQGGPGSGFAPGGQVPTQGGPGGSRTDSGTDSGADSGTSDGS